MGFDISDPSFSPKPVRLSNYPSASDALFNKATFKILERLNLGLLCMPVVPAIVRRIRVIPKTLDP